MTAEEVLPGLSAGDPAGVAAVFGAIAGGLSVLDPLFDGLTLALAALLVAFLVVGRAGAGPGCPARTHRRLTTGLLAGAWTGFLWAPAPVSPYRGALLGSMGLLVWWITRPGSRAEDRPR